MIDHFSSEVKEKLGVYVYRLVDPRNGQTFYVGKGKGDRIFNHANAVDMSFYDNNLDYKRTEEDDDPAKIRVIADIKRSGLNVIHMIQRWGMTEKTAFEVEAAFIDFIGLKQLTNIQNGHHADRGMRFADELEHEFMAEPFVDYPNCPKFILIKITQQSIDEQNSNVYEAVRAKWPMSINKANQYPYVLAVKHGIVIGVYQINKNGWKKCYDCEKAYFEGVEAPKDIQNLFLNKKIPQRYVKAQRPMYCDSKMDNF